MAMNPPSQGSCFRLLLETRKSGVKEKMLPHYSFEWDYSVVKAMVQRERDTAKNTGKQKHTKQTFIKV